MTKMQLSCEGKLETGCLQVTFRSLWLLREGRGDKRVISVGKQLLRYAVCRASINIPDSFWKSTHADPDLNLFPTTRPSVKRWADSLSAEEQLCWGFNWLGIFGNTELRHSWLIWREVGAVASWHKRFPVQILVRLRSLSLRRLHVVLVLHWLKIYMFRAARDSTLSPRYRRVCDLYLICMWERMLWVA